MAEKFPEGNTRPKPAASTPVDDGTHTGLSARFEEEVAAERERLEGKPPRNAVPADGD